MRRIRVFWIGLLPLLLAATALLTLAEASPLAQGGGSGEASDCETGRHKTADPMTLYVGEESEVTSVMTGTCPAYDLPIDMILLVDISNSMTKGTGGSDVSTPDPGLPTRSSDLPTLPAIDPGIGTDPPRPPTRDPAPIPTDAEPEQSVKARRQVGLAQIGPGPIEPTQQPRPSREPTAGTPVRTPDRTLPAPGEPTSISTHDVIRRGEVEQKGDEDLIREVVQAIRDFLDEVEDDVSDGKLRLGLAAFNDRGYQYVTLTDNVNRVRSRLGRLEGRGNTRVDLGLSTATRMLVGIDVRGRTDLDHRKMIVLFSDGKYDRRISARLRTRDGLDILTVAAGRSADWAALRQIATEPQYAMGLRDRKQLVETYRRVAPKQRAVTMDTLTIEDTIADNMNLVAGSAAPAPAKVIDGRTLQWVFTPPTFPITLTYRVQPQEVGEHKVSALAHAFWTDSEGRDGDMPFPEVKLDVLARPTPTSTATATNTSVAPTNTPEATPTPEPPGPVYLPIALKQEEECIPSQQTVDIALVVDTSSSMGRPTKQGGIAKLEAAIGAMKSFVTQLKSGDQATLIWFNSTSSVETPLTTNLALVSNALDTLWSTQATGTRIEQGLQAAYDELNSARHVDENNRAVILVTDGLQAEIIGRQAVLNVANALKRAGIEVYAIGLGEDVDSELLRQVASEGRYYHSPDADDLQIIYTEIAQVIPCP